MSQCPNFGKLTMHEIRMLTYCFDEMMKFIIEEHAELERIADHFNYGDIGETFKDIMQAGLLHYSDLCDMDDAAEAKQ